MIEAITTIIDAHDNNDNMLYSGESLREEAEPKKDGRRQINGGKKLLLGRELVK